MRSRERNSRSLPAGKQWRRWKLFLRSRRRFLRYDSEACSPPRWRARRAPELAAWAAAHHLRHRIGRARVGRCGRVGRESLPRLLPVRRPADCPAPGARLAVAHAPPLGALAGSRLRGPRDRRCDRRAGARRLLRLERPGSPGPPRFLPGQARRAHGQHRRHGGRRSCGDCHDQAPAARETHWFSPGSVLPPLEPLYPAWEQGKRVFLWQLQHFFFTEDLQLLRPQGTNQSLRSGS